MRFLLILLLISTVSATIPTTFQAKRFVEVHNQYLTSTIPPLIWSVYLAQSSDNWAKQCNWVVRSDENLYATSGRVINTSTFNPEIPVHGGKKSRFGIIIRR